MRRLDWCKLLAAKTLNSEGEVRGFKEMKVRASVKPRCEKCKIIKRKGVVLVICTIARHKQRQG